MAICMTPIITTFGSLSGLPATTMGVSTERKSKALFNLAMLTVRQAADSDTESWDHVMAELIVVPSTQETRHNALRARYLAVMWPAVVLCASM